MRIILQATLLVTTRITTFLLVLATFTTGILGGGHWAIEIGIQGILPPVSD
jgi:hypothetical protein